MEEGRKLRREDGGGSAGITEHLTRRVGELLVPSAKPECRNRSFQTLKVGSAGAPEDWKISDSGAPKISWGRGGDAQWYPGPFTHDVGCYNKQGGADHRVAHSHSDRGNSSTEIPYFKICLVFFHLTKISQYRRRKREAFFF